MRTSAIVMVCCVALAGGCKKKGGGGAWLVGEDGLMANVDADGALGAGYAPGVAGDLRGITCLDDDTAFVIGDDGVFLRTFDGGATWQRRDLGTDASLRHVDAAWPGAIYVAGEDGLYRSGDLGDTWETISEAPGWRAVAVDDGDVGAVAIDDVGGVFRWDGARLAAVTEVPGARRVHVSHDGHVAAITGDGGAILRSTDAGATWQRYVVAGTDLDGVWAADDESVMAVGVAGTFAAVSPDGTVRLAGFGGADLHALYLDDAVGYVAGDAGTLHHMTGGRWTRVDLGLTGRILAIENLDGGDW